MYLKLCGWRMHLIDAVAFFLGILVGFVFIYNELILINVDWNVLAIVMLVVGTILVLGKGTNCSPPSLLYTVLLLTIAIMSFIVNETNAALPTLFLLYGLLVVFYLKETVFSAFIIGNIVSVLYFFVRVIPDFFQTGTFLGNRWPLHSTIVGFFVIYLLNETKAKRVWVYSLFMILMLSDFLLASRTALLSCCIAFTLQFIVDFAGKITKKKFYMMLILICAIFAIVLINFESIFTLLFNKWGSNGFLGTVSSRSLMWLDVLSDIHLTGYGADYSLKKYGLVNIHNGYIQAYVSYGMIAGLLYLVWKFTYMTSLFRLHKQPQVKNILIVLIPMMIWNMFESIFLLDPGYPYFGLLDAMLMGRAYRVIASFDRKNHRLHTNSAAVPDMN